MLALAACVALLALTGTRAAADSGGGPRAGSSIIGGGPADFANWEFTVALFAEIRGKPRFFCGGSVITPTKVLLAAHCVFGRDADDLSIVAGRYRLSDTSTGERIEVASYAIHPDYRSRGTRHDVAVITLASPTSQPAITLPTAGEAAAATTPGSRLRVAGWGVTLPLGERRPPGLFLKKAAQRVAYAGRCLRGYTRHIFDPRLMICARGRRAPRLSRRTRAIRRFIGGPIHHSPCRGDSGGPLVADTSAGPRQVGIVSFGGVACGARRFPPVYARVGEELAFILGA